MNYDIDLNITHPVLTKEKGKLDRVRDNMHINNAGFVSDSVGNER